jgi:hypothetical protein
MFLQMFGMKLNTSVWLREFNANYDQMHAGAKTTRAFELGIMDLGQQYPWCMHYWDLHTAALDSGHCKLLWIFSCSKRATGKGWCHGYANSLGWWSAGSNSLHFAAGCTFVSHINTVISHYDPLEKRFIFCMRFILLSAAYCTETYETCQPFGWNCQFDFEPYDCCNLLLKMDACRLKQHTILDSLQFIILFKKRSILCMRDTLPSAECWRLQDVLTLWVELPICFWTLWPLWSISRNGGLVDSRNVWFFGPYY